MRARNLKPSLFANEILGQSDPFLTILFQGLWCIADREGLLEDRPMRIKAEVFPYRESLDIHRYLTELERLGFIHRYQVSNTPYIQVVKFLKHQNPHHTEKKSTLPKPENANGCPLTVDSPLENGKNPPDSLLLIPDSLLLKKEQKAPRKGKRDGGDLKLNYSDETIRCGTSLASAFPKSWLDDSDKPQTRTPRTSLDEVIKRTDSALDAIRKAGESANAALLLETAFEIYLSEQKQAKRYISGLDVWLAPIQIKDKGHYSTYLPRAVLRLNAKNPEVVSA